MFLSSVGMCLNRIILILVMQALVTFEANKNVLYKIYKKRVYIFSLCFNFLMILLAARFTEEKNEVFH